MPDYQQMFPKWAPVPLHKLCPSIDATGLDLLAVRALRVHRWRYILGLRFACTCVCVYLNARPCAQKLLTLDPALRVTARAALEHAFFLDLDRSEL